MQVTEVKGVRQSKTGPRWASAAAGWRSCASAS